MELEREVQWYPGHMAKALRRIREYMRSIDIVVEVVDARIPASGRNPGLNAIAGARTRLVALTRNDLADPETTRRWLEALADRGAGALAVDARVRGNLTRLTTMLTKASADAPAQRAVRRAMIVGIPNSGKSTIVNALIKRSAAKTEARAGVTRHVQWFRLSPAVEIMDTPGVLLPKIASNSSQWKLAMCDAVPAERYDAQEIVAAFHSWLTARKPRTTVPDLEAFARARGFMRRGGAIDYHNAARSYIAAFNDGVFGRISLEAPGDAEAA